MIERKPRQDIRRVLLWMSVVLLSFSAMAVSIRELAKALNVFETLAIRNMAGIVFLLALVLVRKDLRPAIAPRMMGWQALRNAFHFSAQAAWAYSITILPFATVFTLEFTTPIFVAILAAVLLRERLTVPRLVAVGLGFAGILIVQLPKTGTFDPLTIVPLLAAFGFACANIVTKRLTRTESTIAILYWMNVMQLPLNLLAGAEGGFLSKIHVDNLLPVLGICVAGFLGQFALTNAFRYGDAVTVVPIDFMRIPLIAAVGAIFYGEAVDPLVFVGALLIVTGIVYNLRSEARAQSSAQPPAAIPFRQAFAAALARAQGVGVKAGLSSVLRQRARKIAGRSG
jgi:drug/metabolite transporter (DMT)-like permease